MFTQVAINRISKKGFNPFFCGIIYLGDNMKKYISFIFIFFLLFLLYYIFNKKNTVLVCTLEEEKLSGEIKEKIRFIGNNRSINTMESFIVFTGSEDEYTNDYYNYVKKLNECFNIKRNDRVIEYQCKYDIDNLKSFKELYKDEIYSYEKIKNKYEDMKYLCSWEVK